MIQSIPKNLPYLSAIQTAKDEIQWSKLHPNRVVVPFLWSQIWDDFQNESKMDIQKKKGEFSGNSLKKKAALIYNSNLPPRASYSKTAVSDSITAGRPREEQFFIQNGVNSFKASTRNAIFFMFMPPLFRQQESTRSGNLNSTSSMPSLPLLGFVR